jgi:hypothetical protein
VVIERMPGFAPTPALLTPAERAARVYALGPWSFELRGADLDDLRYGQQPVLRSIRFVTRDHDWGTLPVRVSAVESSADDMVVRGETGDGAAMLTWDLRARVAGGALAVNVHAEVRSSFARNRIGLIVLHEPEVAGATMTVGHPDGSADETTFPEQIAPHQPARDIVRLAWPVGGFRAELEFSGDVFEMEDQRNWTDASFKTYSTPLAEPFPVELGVGDTIQQSVRLTCVPVAAGSSESIADPAESPADTADAAVQSSGPAGLQIDIDTVVGHLPQLATMASTAPDQHAGPAAPSPARQLGSALLVELDASHPARDEILARAARDAGGRPLDVRIVASDTAELDQVLDAAGRTDGIRIARIGVFDRATHVSAVLLLEHARSRAESEWPGVVVVGGTRAHFTELNRNIGALDGWRGPLAFSITPFMHDRAGHQLVESIGMQRLVRENATRLADGRELHIGPITLGARFNAVATSDQSPRDGEGAARGYGPQHVSGATDERQDAIAPWLVASVAALASDEVASLTYFEEWGPRGFGADAAAEVFAQLARLAGRPVLASSVDVPGIASLAVRDESATVVFLANLAARTASVHVDADVVTIESGGVRVLRLA